MEHQTAKTVSVIIPCRNEEKYIGRTLDTVEAQDYGPGKLEVLVVDGMSTDKTREIVAARKSSRIDLRMIDNPQHTVPFAFNRAIPESRGEVIIILGAHSEIPPSYIRMLVENMIRLNADNVGGVWETIPADGSIKSRAIAAACSSAIGMGNAYYRIGASEIREVDTVPFGCYPREVFDRIGLFDTGLTRNQDDEFNARLKKHGGRIFLIPEVRLKYFTRDTFGKLWRMFYQYGLYKPLVAKKVGKPATLRQFAPLLFVLGLLAGTVLSMFWPVFIWYVLGQMLVYESALFVSAVHLLGKRRERILMPSFMASVHIIHFAYGFGYLKGIIEFLIIGRDPLKVKVGMSR